MEVGKTTIFGIPVTILLTIPGRCGKYLYNLFHSFKNLLQQLYMFHCLAKCYLLRWALMIVSKSRNWGLELYKEYDFYSFSQWTSRWLRTVSECFNIDQPSSKSCGGLLIKSLRGQGTSTNFGNVCVTNTNCEQQIPPAAGFCFYLPGRKKCLRKAVYSPAWSPFSYCHIVRELPHFIPQ